MNTRAWQATGALIITGAIVGAVAGMAAVIPVVLQQQFAPTPDDGLIGPLSSWLVLTGGIGAAVGAIAGPLLAMGLLRTVALWRVVLEPAIGAILGGLAGWLALQNALIVQLFGLTALVWCSALGALLAAGLLRWRHRKRAAILEGTSAR